MTSLADHAEAYLRSVGVGERLGRFLVGELEPLLSFAIEQGYDVEETVLVPTAELLERAARRLRAGPDADLSDLR